MVDIHQSFVDEESDELDREKFEAFAENLLEEFSESPEAQPVFEEYGPLGWARIMLDYAVDYIGVMLPEMSARDFHEVLFEIFPRKVSTEASSAAAIVAELRAFWEFLQRQYQLKNAAPILALLKDNAVKRLEKELANPANFGIAKSFFTLGAEMGFDMTTQEGLDAFLLYYNSRQAGPLGGGMLPGPGIDEFPPDEFFPDDMFSLPPVVTPKQRAEIRKKRKDQRQARKKNRRKK